MQLKIAKNGNKSIKMSQSEWLQIGQQMSWIKESQQNTDQDNNQKQIKNINTENVKKQVTEKLKSLILELDGINKNILARYSPPKNNLNKFSIGKSILNDLVRRDHSEMFKEKKRPNINLEKIDLKLTPENRQKIWQEHISKIDFNDIWETINSVKDIYDNLVPEEYQESIKNSLNDTLSQFGLDFNSFMNIVANHQKEITITFAIVILPTFLKSLYKLIKGI